MKAVRDYCIVVIKKIQLRLALREMCVCGDAVHMQQLVNISVLFCLSLDEFLELFPVSHLFPDAGVVGVFALFVEHNTSITTAHKSRARNPSIRIPASNEMISVSVELSDTDVCFS